MKENKMAGTWAMYWAEERWIQSFGGTPESERPFGRCTHKWEYIVKRIVKKQNGRFRVG